MGSLLSFVPLCFILYIILGSFSFKCRSVWDLRLEVCFVIMSIIKRDAQIKMYLN